jgi:uncharacterized membrane protein YcaP (DUF421 family)
MLESEMFFDGWQGLLRVAVLATAGYGALIVVLRLSRKRSMLKMNVFDFVNIVIVGELLAITIMDERIALAEGLVGVGVLIGLQVLLSWLTTRSPAMERVINGEPTLLVHRGRLLEAQMQAQRITDREILTAVREEGIADLDEVEAVVLETNGSLSVVHIGTPSAASSLRDVRDTGEGSRHADRRRAVGERRRVPPAHAHAHPSGAER